MVECLAAKFFFKLWSIVSLDLAISLTSLKANNCFFELIGCEERVHPAHDLSTWIVGSHWVDKMVGRHDKYKGKNASLDKRLPMKRKSIIPSIWPLHKTQPYNVRVRCRSRSFPQGHFCHRENRLLTWHITPVDSLSLLSIWLFFVIFPSHWLIFSFKI